MAEIHDSQQKAAITRNQIIERIRDDANTKIVVRILRYVQKRLETLFAHRTAKFLKKCRYVCASSYRG